jgi:hypothetical protein
MCKHPQGCNWTDKQHAEHEAAMAAEGWIFDNFYGVGGTDGQIRYAAAIVWNQILDQGKNPLDMSKTYVRNFRTNMLFPEMRFREK